MSLSSQEIYLDLIAKYPLNKFFPILTVADTWMTPPQGYSVFRLTANRLGPWLLHCHVEWHLSQGMTALISVENPSDSHKRKYDGVDPPPKNLPLDCLIDRTRWIDNPQDLSFSNQIKFDIYILMVGMACGAGIGIVLFVFYFSRFNRQIASDTNFLNMPAHQDDH